MITLEDVAHAAGVSVSTASRALTGKGQIGPKTIDRVRRAAQKLGYRPNSFARGLKTNRSKLIGLVVHNIVNSSFQKLSQVVQEQLSAAGYQVILCITGDDPSEEERYLLTLLDHRVDGIIIIPTGSNFDLLQHVVQQRIPVVTAIRRHTEEGFDAVLQADEAGAHQATKYLIGLGHTRIGVITGPNDTTSGRERLGGYLRALAEAGVAVDWSIIFQGPYRVQTGIDACNVMLASDDRVTAILVANHESSIGVIKSISERGLAVPTQISLLCYEDSPWFEWQKPSITVVDNNPASIAKLAVELVLSGIEHANSNVAIRESRELRVGSKLIIRESCAKR